MEYLAPSLEFVRKLQAKLNGGNSLAVILPQLLSQQESIFHRKLRKWWFIFQNGKGKTPTFPTYYQKALVTVLENGLNGASIFEHLDNLETEMSEELDQQIKAHLESLPFKLLLPLMLFYFPAFVILLFGPLLNQFLSKVGS